MTWILYNILFAIGFVLMLPYFLMRMRRRGGYRAHFLQRFGRYEPEVQAALAEGPRVWVHAVSVGEIFVALRLMDELRARRPGTKFVLSTTTSTGHAIAEKELKSPDVLIYFPLDFPSVTKRVLGLVRPTLLVLVECELWPNLIRLARAAGIPVALVNGRVSDHSYRGYRKLTLFTRPLLREVNVMCVQSEADRRRLLALGAPDDRLHVVGSTKYDMTGGDGEASAKAALRAIGVADDRLVLLGGSTWPGEEAILLDLYASLRAKHPDLFLVLVPRHFERAGDVAKEIEARGLRLVRRTTQKDGTAPAGTPDVLLVDTTGELKGFYGCATVIFVGKSLTEHGGQNPIEPAMLSKPVIVGPNMENFPGVMDDFLGAEALIQVRDAAGLASAVESLLADPALRARYGEKAGRLVREKAGAVRKTLDLVEGAWKAV